MRKTIFTRTDIHISNKWVREILDSLKQRLIEMDSAQFIERFTEKFLSSNTSEPWVTDKYKTKEIKIVKKY